jgi:hypothetical protein
MPSRAYVGAFGFKGPDQQKPVGVLSGGEKNRLNLALTLKAGGNVLLLDEPTNDLDVETLRSLEDALLEFPGCAVVISHDRWFLDRVATHMLAWEGTEEDPARWFWYEGNFADYEKNKVERLGQEAARPHRVTYRKLRREQGVGANGRTSPKRLRASAERIMLRPCGRSRSVGRAPVAYRARYGTRSCSPAVAARAPRRSGCCGRCWRRASCRRCSSAAP